MARTSINKDGVLVVHVENPEELHSILNQIFGEDDFPSGKFPDIWPEMPTTHFDDGDYPKAEDCTACDAKDCPIRKAPYGSTVPAPSLREAMERTYDRMVKDKALRDAMKTEKLKADLKYREAKLARETMVPDPVGFTSKDLAEAVRKMTTPFPGAESSYLWPTEPNLNLGVPYGDPSKDKLKKPVIKPKFVEEIDGLVAKLGAMQKKARENAEDALAEKLYKRLSKNFYRDRAARYSRTAELLSQVNNLTEENRKLKADLSAKGEAMEHYKRAVANPDSLSWNTSHDKRTGAFVYVTDYEFDTLKALADGSATVIPTSKNDAVVKPTASPEPVWFRFIDPETGSLTVPMLNAWVVVKTGFVTTQVMQRVEADHERAIRCPLSGRVASPCGSTPRVTPSLPSISPRPNGATSPSRLPT